MQEVHDMCEPIRLFFHSQQKRDEESVENDGRFPLIIHQGIRPYKVELMQNICMLKSSNTQ